MEAVRVQADGVTTSFRYPHFLVGRQPSYRMPPPATIYGHVCSAIGELIDPATVEFGYTFTYGGVGDDLELLHMVTAKSGRWPDGRKYPMNLEGTTNPSLRQVLLYPSLTLYLRGLDPALNAGLAQAFREPRYAVALGRSQDLMSYRSVEIVELEPSADVYFEATLLPWSLRDRTREGVGVTMPRFIDPENRQRVIWSPFVVLEGKTLAGRGARSGGLSPGESGEVWWSDPESPVYRDRRRAVIWHGFLPNDADELSFVAVSPPPLG